MFIVLFPFPASVFLFLWPFHSLTYSHSVCAPVFSLVSHADAAAKLVQVQYTNVQTPLVTIDQAIAANSFFPNTVYFLSFNCISVVKDVLTLVLLLLLSFSLSLSRVAESSFPGQRTAGIRAECLRVHWQREHRLASALPYGAAYDNSFTPTRTCTYYTNTHTTLALNISHQHAHALTVQSAHATLAHALGSRISCSSRTASFAFRMSRV